MCSGRVRISSSGLLSILLPPPSALGSLMVISFIFCTGGAAVPVVVVVGGDWSLGGWIVAAALPLPRPTCCWAPSCSLTPPPPRGAAACGMSPGRRVSTPPPPRDLPRPTPRPLPPPRVDIFSFQSRSASSVIQGKDSTFLSTQTLFIILPRQYIEAAQISKAPQDRKLFHRRRVLLPRRMWTCARHYTHAP